MIECYIIVLNAQTNVHAHLLTGRRSHAGFPYKYPPGMDSTDINCEWCGEKKKQHVAGALIFSLYDIHERLSD